ncbi:MAG: non-canonical purine NTP pyrophosphatase [Bdellovibrio sp.]|nr:non-canonical purine NTP pyrophosphatase [Bdellovibrio sp.]
MELLFASGNAHKAEELALLFEGSSFRIVSAPESVSVAETADNLYGNAEIKAQAYFQKYKRPTVADDSGLFVEALPDELGVMTARFGGEHLSALQRCELLLKRLENETHRNAYFMCVLCFVLSPHETFFFEGRLNGFIGEQVIGEQGFGYDPIFYPNDLKDGPLGARSLAQDVEYKMAHSHRARAAVRARSFLTSYIARP